MKAKLTDFSIRSLITFVCVLLAFSSASASELAEEKVIFYNWSGYIPDRVLDDFTEETGIKVEYITFNNSDVMYNYIKALDARTFDLVMSPAEFVERMGREGLLRRIDQERISRYKDLNQNLLDRGFDPGNRYSIPFTWGSTSIVYDSKRISDNIESWNDLWKPRWRKQILLVNKTRQVFYATLKSLGFSGNTENPDEIKQAYQKLLRLVPNVRFMTNDPAKSLIENDVALGLSWNGAVKSARNEKPTLNYVYPEEGAYFWMDSLVIPASAPNLDNAYILIDYLLRPNVAVKWMTELGYASSNVMTRTLLNEKLRNDPMIFAPAAELEKAEFPRERESVEHLYQLYWTKLSSVIADNLSVK